MIGCNYKNACNEMESDIYCILCDGTTFHFFLLSMWEKTTFQSVVFPTTGGRTTARQTLTLVDTHSDNLVGFWQEVRILCESIYYILLQVYSNCADSYNSKSARLAEINDKTHRNRMIGWRVNATAAMSRARAATEKRFEGDVDQAEELANEAMAYLQKRYDCRLAGAGP